MHSRTSSHAAVNASVAAALGIELTDKNRVLLRGVTGSRVVSTIQVESLIVGDLQLVSRRLPIVVDALGGAEPRREAIEFRFGDVRCGLLVQQSSKLHHIRVPHPHAAVRRRGADALDGDMQSPQWRRQLQMLKAAVLKRF